MKKIDRLLITSFIPPFLVTFGIATFVLLMQILWVYIDDIAGKGLGGFVIMELLAYKCVGLVPMALPLAILISGVMVMGGLAEHYELSSLKSAGVSLTRIMRPIMYFGVGAMIISYLCNDYIIPVANLNFGSRMYDIREKKPTMSLEAGVFNDDFGSYAIYLGGKGEDGKSITDVLIYDHSQSNSDRISQVVAESGIMSTSEDGNYLTMKLFNGHQYVESRPSQGNKTSGLPFVRTSFASWNKVFDLTEFNMSVTDQGLFSQNRSMMSISQLAARIDTIQQEIDKRYLNLAKQVGTHFSILPIDSLYPQTTTEIAATARRDSLRREKKDSLLNVDSGHKKDSTTQLPVKKKIITPTLKKTIPKPKPKKKKEANIPKPEAVFDAQKSKKTFPIEDFAAKPQSIDNWLNTVPKTEKRRYISKAKSSARAILSQAQSAHKVIDRTMENKVKHIYDMHTKYSMAVVCLIFVFIGAPLGAIVRKGGFGYPLLVSIVAFIVFIVLTIFCRKIAETFIIPAALAAWLPCLILTPIGFWLTFIAMTDRKLFKIPEWINTLIQIIRSAVVIGRH